MSSQNMGEQQGKPDYSVIYDDFPTVWINSPVTDAVIKREYGRALEGCLEYINLEDIKAARDYGMKKYSRMNWRESRGTKDHQNFLDANHRSIYRHMVAYQKGETHDPESGCHHLAHVALRCMIAFEYTNGSASEVGSSYQESQDSDCLGSQPTDPSTLYDWSYIPTPYDWCATDKDGEAWYYAVEPTLGPIGWHSTSHSRCLGERPDLAKNWQDSLEERPKS